MSISVVQVAKSQNGSATFASNVTTGNTVIIVAYALASSGTVLSTSGIKLGGSEVAGTVALQGYQSGNSGTASVGHAIWMLPNCSGGSSIVSWAFTPSGTGMTAVGTIAYEISGLGNNPLPTMGNAATNAGSTAVDTGSTGQLQFANEFVLAAAAIPASGGSTTAPAGWTATNNGTNNYWAGYQISSVNTAYDWAQTATVSDYWSAGVVSVQPNSGTPASYRLFNNGITGPAAAVNYSGSFLSGVVFKVMAGNCWFEGYWWWVCSSGGQATTPTKCALWQSTGIGTPTRAVVPGSVVTSGTLSPGWNYIALPTPVQLAIGTQYTAAIAVNGPFPDTNNVWAAGDTYPAGICIGPLNAGGGAGTNVPTYSTPQGVFTTSGNDPSTTCPQGTDGTRDNFWLDVQISTQAPAGYMGTYRLWPNNGGSQYTTSGDSTVNYVVGTEIDLLEPCTLRNIWYFSPTGTTQLATRADVWDISTQQSVASIPAPTWSGAAGSGWVSAALAGSVTLPAGKYRVTVYNGAATPDSWSSKSLNYYLSGWSLRGDFPTCDGAGGITSGPLYAPDTANAQVANYYSATGSGPGQAVFAVGPPNAYPNTYVDDLFQNYWVDLEVTPAATSSLLMASLP